MTKESSVARATPLAHVPVGEEGSETALKPGIRVDGGKRIDLNKQRVATRMSGVPKGAPTVHQIEAAQTARRKADEKSRQHTTKLIKDDGGKDGRG